MREIRPKEEPYYEVSQVLAIEIKAGTYFHQSRRLFYETYEPQARRWICIGYDQKTKEEIDFYVKRFAIQWCELGDRLD